MKKVLFASTALVAFTGAAAADIAITGSAEMGIFDNSPGAGVTDTSNVQFHTDVDVTFAMSGETDGGLAFGVSVDLDEASGVDGGLDRTTVDADYNIFISGGFGTLTMGDTDGAMDWALTEVVGPGTLRDEETTHSGFFGSYLDGAVDGQILRYDFSAGDFGIAVSTEVIDNDDINGDGTVTAAEASVGNAYAIGVKYGVDLGGTMVDLGLGYQKADGISGGALVETDLLGVSAAATFGGLRAGIVYADAEAKSGGASVDGDVLMVGVEYAAGPLTVGANWGEQDWDGTAIDAEGYAITANYDLGGGAIIQFGYADSEDAGVDSGDQWSFGLRFNF